MKGLIQLSACLTDTTENWPQKNRKKEGGKKKKVIPFKSLKAINFLKKGNNTNKTKPTTQQSTCQTNSPLGVYASCVDSWMLW